MKTVLSFCLLLPLCLLTACPPDVPPPKDDEKEQPEPDPDPLPSADAGNTEPTQSVDAGGDPSPVTADAGTPTTPDTEDAGTAASPVTDDAGTAAPPVTEDAGTAAPPVTDDAGTTAPPVTEDAGTSIGPGSEDAGTTVANEPADAGVTDLAEEDAGTPTCPNGTTGDGIDCTDINECNDNNGGCNANASCTNAAVSGDAPSCECNAGYEGNGQECTDIDECATNNGGCPSNATCTDADTAGVAPLCTCNTGYTEDIMGNCKPDALDWDVEYTDTNHSIFILNTALDGIAQVEAGDYIGVFYARENHFLGCGAFTEWNGETTMLAAQGEELGDVENDGGVAAGVVAGGFEVGEEFHWVFWDASSGNTFSLIPIFDATSPNGNSFVPNGISQVVGFESPNPGWIAEITDNNHSVFIKDTAFDNWPEIKPGDYVGVFFEDSSSEPQCGGLVKWEGAFTQIPAYGAEGTGIVEGFAVGETFQWRVWDASANAFHEATATYAAAGQDVYAPNGLSFVDELVATP